MKIQVYTFLLFSLTTLFASCQQEIENSIEEVVVKNISDYQLNDYLKIDSELDKYVDSIVTNLDESQLVAQLLMPAAGRMGQKPDTISRWINEGIIGGVLLLNGEKSQMINWVSRFDSINKTNSGLPFLYSADAEPSLVNRKIIGSKTVKKANIIGSNEEVKSVARSISKDLLDIGINYNFAPVVDMSKNKTVGYRGFGKDSSQIIPFSNTFIQETQQNNIIATAKHFPGHGLVSGDTHKSLQQINGELKEIKNYPPLIADGVLSIMVAHIAIQNNEKYSTDNLPSTVSKRIVTDLLRDELNFKGLIVTDAMNMGGVTNVKNASVLAIKAGCDILLMPKNTRLAHQKLLLAIHTDEEFKAQVTASVKRIVRMKICLGLMK